MKSGFWRTHVALESNRGSDKSVRTGLPPVTYEHSVELMLDNQRRALDEMAFANAFAKKHRCFN